jgi:hypothetical protein
MSRQARHAINGELRVSPAPQLDCLVTYVAANKV